VSKICLKRGFGWSRRGSHIFTNPYFENMTVSGMWHFLSPSSHLNSQTFHLPPTSNIMGPFIRKKVELVSSSTNQSMSVDAKLDWTPEECYLVVHELGKLHPDVILANNERRHTFALQKQQQNRLLKSTNNDFTSLSSMANNTSNTPITDAIISTMLSQNTTAANQNRAFAALKKTFPNGWEECAAETNTVLT